MADNSNILQKPPRLLSTEQGAYDWREFDRWIRRVYDLLAIRKESKAYNVLSELETIQSLGIFQSSSSELSVKGETIDEGLPIYLSGGDTLSTVKDENLPLYVLDNENISTDKNDVAPAYLSGGENFSSQIQHQVSETSFLMTGGETVSTVVSSDDYLTLYWMGV